MLIIYIFQVCFTFDVAVDAQHDVSTSCSQHKICNPAHPSFLLIV